MKAACLAFALSISTLTAALATTPAQKYEIFCYWPTIATGTIVDAQSRGCALDSPYHELCENLLTVKVRVDTVLRSVDGVHPGDVIEGVARYSNALPLTVGGTPLPINFDGSGALGQPATGTVVDTAEARRELIGRQYIFDYAPTAPRGLPSMMPWKMAELDWATQELGKAECQPVWLSVDAGKAAGQTPRPWAYFGYDEPNYTYSPTGKKLLNELAALSPLPVYVRAHNLFTSGDGTGALKWGSTNVYTEDAQGRPTYDWTIIDRIFDAYRDAGVRPLVELGFMPQALTTGPAPYRHDFPRGPLYTGWTYPPKDYGKWGELVFQFAKHLRTRYGDAAVKNWLWEVWNEPDIGYWHGTPEEYFRLYDVSADALLRAVPFAKIGGPHSTAPSSASGGAFLRAFLEHAAHGKNYATGKNGSPLDYIGFHAKGRVTQADGYIKMGMAEQLRAAEAGFKIVAGFSEWKNTPIILGENDPEPCAACTPPEHPENWYRNFPVYAAYNALEIKKASELANKYGVTLQGAVTWAFQFDGQPYFAALRELTTHGIDKPVLNGFKLLGILGDTQLSVVSSAPVDAEAIVNTGVPAPVVDAIAARKNREVDILVMYYRDDVVGERGPRIPLRVTGLPAAKVQIEYDVVGSLRDALWLWQEMGAPQSPTPEQYKQLEAAGKDIRNGPPFPHDVLEGTLDLNVTPMGTSLTLVRIRW